MKNWWQRRSLKVRLAVWFAGVASGILLGLTPVVYWLIERRLHIELDHQLRIDWNLIEAHLESDTSGRIQWRKGSPATPDSPGYAGTWFDVWSGDEPLLHHWPVQGAQNMQSPRPPRDQTRTFYNIELDKGRPARALEQPAGIGGRKVILRVFRDESGLHRTLREVLVGFALSVPLAALLAALGGYVMAGRTLKPIGAMAEQARQITFESLGRRLPNPNPHDELGQLATVFNETLQRLQDSFEALKQFTADASHELRTPMTALRAVGEVGLRNAEDAAGLRETIGSMLEEAEHLNDLTDSLLLLATVESGRSPPHLEPVRLAELLAEVRESVEVLAMEKQQTIESFGETDVVAMADRVLLREAVMNILHNAIRYSPPASKVAVRSFRRNHNAVIEIADEGPGIAPEHQEKIFERFYRIDKARSRAEGGAGLGLAIAKLSVEQQGGGIELESEVGRGSRFRIVLPLAEISK
jgi:heavy metal sensor kinase